MKCFSRLKERQKEKDTQNFVGAFSLLGPEELWGVARFLGILPSDFTEEEKEKIGPILFKRMVEKFGNLSPKRRATLLMVMNQAVQETVQEVNNNDADVTKAE